MKKKHDYSNTALFVSNTMIYSFDTAATKRYMSQIYSQKFRPYVLSCEDKADRMYFVRDNNEEIKFGFVVKKIFEEPRILIQDSRGRYLYFNQKTGTKIKASQSVTKPSIGKGMILTIRGL